ncbi:hypothetical protein Bbelb_386980 [Branchiostoma belcheri]|nr:hypothetical protein Bbelb_386980 [Branchiostoma belcheri]
MVIQLQDAVTCQKDHHFAANGSFSALLCHHRQELATGSDPVPITMCTALRHQGRHAELTIVDIAPQAKDASADQHRLIVSWCGEILRRHSVTLNNRCTTPHGNTTAASAKVETRVLQGHVTEGPTVVCPGTTEVIASRHNRSGYPARRETAGHQVYTISFPGPFTDAYKPAATVIYNPYKPTAQATW